jgi:hypothetical protein
MKKHVEEFSLDGFLDGQGLPLGSGRGRSARAWPMLCTPVASSVTACLLILAAGQIVENWIGILGLGIMSLLAFHLLFWSLRDIVNERSLKSSDYVFLAIALLSLTFLLNGESVQQPTGFLLLVVGLALKATKVSAELLGWHTAGTDQSTVTWG